MDQSEFFDDLKKRSYLNGVELETDRDTRRVLGAIHDLVEAEKRIPACKTIEEVEQIRFFSQGIQFYSREKGDLGASIVGWAKRVAMLCQLRISQLQEQ